MSATEKTRYPIELALEVAQQLSLVLSPHCLQIQTVGSVRRAKPTVGDLEILYIPRNANIIPDGELFSRPIIAPDPIIAQLITSGVLAKRLKSNGTTTFGQWNKLLLHTATGLPVDLFATSPVGWWNNLVARTGGKAMNVEIASAAIRQGMHWEMYGGCFTIDRTGAKIYPQSEKDVFSIVGKDYLEPHLRP
jgi:DNA polymerase/3'-5' exonuclease PolX